MPGKTKHTLESIAELAGVSRATVSRVINNKNNVSAEAKKRVSEVIKQEKFYPNASARSLASNRTNNIGVLFWGYEPLFLTVPIYREIVQGVQEKTVAHDFNMVLYATQQINEDLCHKIIGQQVVDGIIIMGEKMYVDYLRIFVEADFPVVIIGKRDTGELKVPYVCSNYIEGTYQATQYLLESGRHQLAYIQSVPNTLHGDEKFWGFKKALNDYNKKFNKKRLLKGKNGKIKDSQLKDFFVLNSEIDGIVVSDDARAQQAIKVLREMDKKVPEQVSVIGFDDTKEYRLSTVRQHKLELGSIAVEMLNKLIEGEKVESTILSTELIIRETS